MVHVNTIKTNTETYTLEEFKALQESGNFNTTNVKDVSVFNQSADQSQCKDGKDDGKIGFWEGLKETVKGAVKGVVNGIKGCFTDKDGKFSLGKTLKTALTVGACFIPGVGPVIATGLCAYGAVKGATGIAKGVAAAATAQTDAEKRAAFQSIGANGVATAASVVGLKGSVNALANQAGVAAQSGSLTANLKNLATSGRTGTGITATAKNLVNNITKGTRNYYSSAWADASSQVTSTGIKGTLQTAGKVAKQTGMDTAANIYEAASSVKNAAQDKLSKIKKGNKSQVTHDPGFKTKTSTKNVSDLPEDVQLSIKSGNSSGQIDGTHSYEVMGNGKVKITETIDLSKTGIRGAYNELKTFTDVRGAFGDPAFYGGVNGATAAWTLASTATSDAATGIEQTIPQASQSVVEVTSQTGREFDLLDYTYARPRSM